MIHDYRLAFSQSNRCESKYHLGCTFVPIIWKSEVFLFSDYNFQVFVVKGRIDIACKRLQHHMLLNSKLLYWNSFLQGNSLLRALNVAAFAVSGYASSEGRHCKPFNPLLGETYEADYPEQGIRFFSEKVSAL